MNDVTMFLVTSCVEIFVMKRRNLKLQFLLLEQVVIYEHVYMISLSVILKLFPPV